MATKLFRSLNMITRGNRFLNEGLEKRQNHSKVSRLKTELEAGFNDQVATEFFASFSYLAMASFFGRQSIALEGCANYFMNQVFEEREHAHKLINYLNQRGSHVFLKPIPSPKSQNWDSPLVAFQEALELEKSVTQRIFELHKMADEFGDTCACTFLENEFLEVQVEEFDKVSRILSQLKQIGPDGLGIYIFDRYLYKSCKKDASKKET